MLDLKRSVVLYSMRLNHVGLAGFCGHLQAALSAAAGWHFKQARLLRRSWHALGTDLLHLMPGTAGHDIVNVRSLEAVEGGGGSHGVSTHVLKDQPVTHLQVRQVTLLNNAIKAITRWAPDTAGVPDLIWLWLLM